MTAQDAINSIEPGSVPSGGRGALEAGLQETLGAPEAAPAAGDPSAVPAPSGADPLGALLGGGVTPGGKGLITDGLSVGAGTGPPSQGAGPMSSPDAERLRQVALQAATPTLRAAARRLLRRLDGQSRRKI